MIGRFLIMITKKTKPKKTIEQYKDEYSPYYFDKYSADRAVYFIENQIVHIEGDKAGQYFVLERWQKKLVRRIFGWKHRTDNTRKYKTVYIEIPRKNGKSAFASALALYILFADGEMGAQVVSVAAEKEQARVVYGIAKEMVERNPKLIRKCNAYRNNMVVYETASSYKVMSADAYSKHGLNIHAAIVDELHVQPNRELVDVIRTSMGARRQPLLICLTTAGHDKNSICWEYHEHAIEICSGQRVDPSFLGVIFAADEKDDWTKPETWKKANPNYGVSIRKDYLKKECNNAKMIPSYENTFKRLHLNLWTEQDHRWLPMEYFYKCEKDFDEKSLHGQICYAGLDLSSTEDLTALSLIFPDKQFKTYKILTYFWTPEKTIPKKVKTDKVPYDVWTKKGYIEVCKGNRINYDQIRKKINELGEIFNIKEIAIDRWNATQLATQLDDDGFTVAFFGQGYASMSAPAKEFERLLMSEEIFHNGHPTFEWNCKNVAKEQDSAGNIKPSKKFSKQRIDGVVAAIMGLGRAIAFKQEKENKYNKRGLISI